MILSRGDPLDVSTEFALRKSIDGYKGGRFMAKKNVLYYNRVLGRLYRHGTLQCISSANPHPGSWSWTLKSPRTLNDGLQCQEEVHGAQYRVSRLL